MVVLKTDVVSYITCKIWGFHSSTNDDNALSTSTSMLPVWVPSTSSASDPDSWLRLHVTAVYLLYSQNMCGKGVIQTGFKLKPLGRGVSAFYYQTTVYTWLQDKELVKGVSLPSCCTDNLWVRRMCWNFVGWTAMSRGECFWTFQKLMLPSSSGCCWWFDRTTAELVLPNHQQLPEDGDRVSPWNIRIHSHFDVTVCWENSIEFCHHESFKTY